MLLSAQLLNESLLLVPMLSNVYGANSTGTARDRLILDIVLKAVGNTLGELLTREGRELLEMLVAQIVHQGIIPGTYSGDKAYLDTLSGVLASASSSGYSLSNTRELHALTNLAFNATAHLHDAMYNPDGTIDYSVTRGLPLQLVSLLHGRVINRLTTGKSREEYATELRFDDSSTRMDQQLNEYVREGVLDPSGTVYKRLRAQLLAFNTLELYGLQELLLLSNNPYGADWTLSYIESDASGNLRRGNKIGRTELLSMSEVLQRAILLQNLNYLRSQDLIDENNNLYFRDATNNRVAIKVRTPDGERAMRLADLTLVGLSDPRLQTAIDNGNTVLGSVIDQTSRNAAELLLRNGSRSEYIFNREVLKLIDESLAQAKHISFLSSSTGISDLNLLEELAKAAGLGDLTDASSEGIQYTTARLKELQLLALNTNRSIEELLLERIKLVLILAEDFGGEQFVSGAFVSTLQTIINNESFNRLNNEGATLRTLEELSSSILRSKQNAENLFGGFAIAEYILNDVGGLFVNADKRKEMQTLLEAGRSALRLGDREQAYIISQQLRAMADEVSGGQLSYYHIRLANKLYSDLDYLASVLSGLDLQVLDVLTRGVTEGNLDIYRSGNRLSADPRINTEVLEFINRNATDTQSPISTDSLFVQNGINSIALVGSYWLRVQRMLGAEKEREMSTQRYKAANTYINNLSEALGINPEELLTLNQEGFASKITRDNIRDVHSYITSFLLATHLNETSNIVRNILHRTGSDTTLIHELLSYISEYHNEYNKEYNKAREAGLNHLQASLRALQAADTWVKNTLTPTLRSKYYSDADIGNVVSLSRRTLALDISPDKLAEFLTFAVTNTNTIVMGDNVKRLRWATYWQSIMNQSEEDTYNLSEFDLVVAGFYGDGSGLITESEALNLATTRYYRATKSDTNTSTRIESEQAFESTLRNLFKAVRNTGNPDYQGVLPDGINKGESYAGYVFEGLAVDEGGNFLLDLNGNKVKVNGDVAERFWNSEIQEGGILHLLKVSNTPEAKREFIENFTARGALFLTEYLGTEFSMRVHRGTGTTYVILNTLALRLAAVENLRLQDMASVDLYKFTYGGNSTIETSEFAEVATQFFPGAFTDTNVDSILTATGYASPQGNLTSKFIDELKLRGIIQPDSLSVGSFRTLLNLAGKDLATVDALLPVIIDSAYGKDTHRYLTMDLSNEQNEEIVKAADERRALLLRDDRFTGGVLQGLSIEDVKLLLTNGTLRLDTATRILMSLNDVQVDADDKNLTPVEEVLKNAGILAQDGSGVYRITEGWATGLTISEALGLLNEQAADGTGRTRAQVIQDTREDINTSDGDFVNAIKKAVLGMEDDLHAIRNHVVKENPRLEGPNDQN